ncbi:S-4TM family putative pore-forming effector [Prevotella intermedia]|uniref:Uncharacterized protein n=1 Tax=Prevotella intermedia TaxID=28131 RepID=A0A2G8IAC1_PREIN|nr:S-4TM family putative pore-forming effector [Prevotella intermedia]PIK20453.1 hypothetical protein CTI18_03465 [Prevotella intermedia]
MANNIVELENRQEHINQLKAARHLYTKAGNYTTAYVIICVLIPIVISIGRIFVDSLAPLVLHTLTAYTLMSLVMGFLLESQISKFRNTAAKIQQLFDSDVLGLKWNAYLWGKKPSLEDVNENIGNLPDKDFVDWYDTQVRDMTKMEAALICQRTNLVYDSKLRKKFNSIINVIAGSAFVLILIAGFYKNEGMRTAIVFIGVPLVPIIKWFFSVRRQNLNDIDRCESLKSFIDECLDNLKINHMAINECTLYRIQDGIYKHRKTAFKIPDCLYNYMRSSQEDKVHMMVNKLSQ